jgi:hypothetical protein
VKTSIDSEVAQALLDTMISPNCLDSNFESANVVDGLYEVARAIRFAATELADAIRGQRQQDK